MSRNLLLGGVAALLLFGAVSFGADWTIGYPSNCNPASSINGGGTGPELGTATCVLYKFNGSFYGSYGSVAPTPVQADDFGMWEVTMYPAEGVSQFLIGDYEMTIGDADIYYFSVVSP